MNSQWTPEHDRKKKEVKPVLSPRLKAGELGYRPLQRLQPALMLRLYMSMTYANTDEKRISSWPAAGTEFLISAIIFMTFFPVVRSNPSRRELLCICEGAIRLTNLSGKRKKKKDKPIFTKHSLDSCVISQDLYALQQREGWVRSDLFFFKSC